MIMITNICVNNFAALPNLNDTSQEPIVVFSGEDAYIDCKVENQSNYTVLFKFINPDHDVQNSVIISAGNIRITSDTRFSVLHHTGMSFVVSHNVICKSRLQNMRCGSLK